MFDNATVTQLASLDQQAVNNVEFKSQLNA